MSIFEKDMEKWQAHNGCPGCIYFEFAVPVDKCMTCKGTATPDSDEFKSRPDNYYDGRSTENKNVDHPSHYNQGSIECIDAMVAAFGTEKTALWCKINAFKYLWRSDYKNGMEDLKKASWYINKAINLIEESEGKSND